MTLEDRYEMLDEAHGEGGFGKISKRRDNYLERIVAIKELKLLSDPAARSRFEREAKVLAKMSYPNVPAIYDVQFSESHMFILCEFVDGKPLSELISDTTIPPLEQVRRWFTQVAAALEHAHSKGIIHRDVKPANIIISEDRENATLVDFGIALSAEDAKSLTKEGYVIGTPQYICHQSKLMMRRLMRDLTYIHSVSHYTKHCLDIRRTREGINHFPTPMKRSLLRSMSLSKHV